MSFFGGLVKMVTGGLVGDIGKAIDRNVTSDEERMALHNELAGIEDRQKERVHEAFVMVQQNVTDRHAADMKSDSWLAKNVRPLTLITMTVVTIGYAFTGLYIDIPQDSYKEAVFNAGLQAFVALDMLVYGFYFGSRGVEKVATHVATAFASAKAKAEEAKRPPVTAWDN